MRLPDGRLLFVGADLGPGRAYAVRIVRALWGAGVLTLLLGLAGGALVSRSFLARTDAITRACRAISAALSTRSEKFVIRTSVKRLRPAAWVTCRRP